jgi:hypothetical protein
LHKIYKQDEYNPGTMTGNAIFDNCVMNFSMATLPAAATDVPTQPEIVDTDPKHANL